MLIACPALSELPNLRHGFFTREGGVSDGLYASLNMGYGSGDDAGKVSQNRAIAASALDYPADALCTPYQVHSNVAVITDKPWHWQDAPQADALVTNTPGLMLGILTADCLPILFADAKRHIIAAAHAGWKGALSGIIEATLASMQQLGAQLADIRATIGPGIAQGSYEVGAGFHERFLEENEENALYFIPGARDFHYLFDLKAYAKDRLKNASVAQINLLAHDTCLEENAFFSYRRATLRAEPVYGRQLSAIVLTE